MAALLGCPGRPYHGVPRSILFAADCPVFKSLDFVVRIGMDAFELLDLPFFLMWPFRCGDRLKRHYNLAFSPARHGNQGEASRECLRKPRRCFRARHHDKAGV